MKLPTWSYLQEVTYKKLPAWSYLHEVTYKKLPSWSYLHEVTCMKLPTRSYLQEVTCMKLPAWSYLHEVTYMKLPAWSYLHEVTCMKLPTRKRQSSKPPVRWHVRNSAILRNVELWFFTDVSGQYIGPIFKCQEVQVYRRFGTTCRSHLQGSRSPSVPMFWDNLSLPSSRVKKSKCTDVSGQPIGPIFNGQEVQVYIRFGTTYRSHLQGSRSSNIPTLRDNLSIPSSRVKKFKYTTFRDHLSVQSSRVNKSKKKSFLFDFLTLRRWDPTGCPETSVQNYHCTLCNIPEERNSHLHRDGSMTSRPCTILPAPRNKFTSPLSIEGCQLN
jgi:hypothetical protein